MPTPKPKQSVPRWTRRGAEWWLIAIGQPLYRIEPFGRRWLCWTCEDDGSDGFMGAFPSLTAAKAYWTRRAIAVLQWDSRCDQAPL